MNDFTYMRKPVAVEALRVPPDDNETRLWPRWFMRDIACGVLKPLEDGRVLVVGATSTQDVVVSVGEWLVREADGRYEIYTDKEFVHTFEKPITADAG